MSTSSTGECSLVVIATIGVLHAAASPRAYFTYQRSVQYVSSVRSDCFRTLLIGRLPKF